VVAGGRGSAMDRSGVRALDPLEDDFETIELACAFSISFVPWVLVVGCGWNGGWRWRRL
jgi:hypothetical protein